MSQSQPAATSASTPQTETVVRYAPHGAAHGLFLCRDREIVLDGPAGTGKSFAMLQKVHLALLKYPGARALLARKTLRSLAASSLVTYQRKVLHASGAEGVRYFGGSAREPAQFRYPNGSVLIIGGLDKPEKVMSTEYDMIAVDEATELNVDDWESLLTRLRNGVMPYQQLIGCCNPQQPTHWLNQRMLSGLTLRLSSRHEDNPTVTDAYLAILDALTGVRRERLRFGHWVMAEGMVYQDAWEPARHLLPRRTYSTRPDSLWGDCGIDRDWPRYLAIDWGYRNPAAVQWWAKRPDGQLLLYRELYTTMTLVEDLAREALALMGWKLSERGALLPTNEHADPLPREVIADHDAEDRATFERHFGLAVFPAHKGKDSVNDGIQAVTKRLTEDRLHILEGSLVQRDPLLDAAKKPCSTAEEFESYVWDTRAGRPPKEQPIDDNNHAMDALRYLVTYFDRGTPDAGSIPFEAVGY